MKVEQSINTNSLRTLKAIAVCKLQQDDLERQ